MDAKDLRTESAVSERNNDGSKYSQSGSIAVHCDRNKSYQDIGSNSLGKVDVPNARPCAVIGPDRVVPPPAVSEAYHIKKGPAEPWPCMDSAYRRLPEYPHKLTNYQNPTRNISPRQTFQENMQRIMVPPTYSSIKVNEDANYAQVSDRSNGLSKNIKLNMPPEPKFCDVPYAVNPTNNEHKNIRNPEMCLPSVNPTHSRTAPHGWPPGSINLRSSRLYGAPEMYQYQDYPSCAGPRPVVPRPHRTVPEEGFVYADPYYQDGNIRFKPYPNVKERYPQQRYEYIGNYSNPFHPPPGFPSHKYEVQKSIPPHPYPPYPPIKYLDSRIADPVMEGFQRNPQGLGPNFNIQYRSQVIHPNFGPVVGNSPQNKIHSYPSDAHMKPIPPNKLPYDNNTKTYIEYENSRPKIYPSSESYYVNEMARMPMKSQVIMPNYSALNMHNVPPNPYYKKDTQHLKNYDHLAHLRNVDPNLNIHNPMSRHAPVFSPNTLAISPTDSNTSNDTTQTLGTSQEDCGYVSQSSSASVRSIDSGNNRIPNEYFRKYYDNRYGPIVRTSPVMSKSQLNSNNNTSKDKKQINVRQFLQMWNEGDEEQEENSSKEKVIQTGSSDKINFAKSHESMNNQEQLYVLGLVNVPSEELAKYEHIQKVSKLPENIKGYNSIELLNQFEEVIESSHINNYRTPTPKESIYHSNIPMKGAHPKLATGVIPPRPVSPLDVEAKISQSVIHKEVGCNFEIKPCSPKMLNVEVAAPVQNILAERSIEKVANPVMLKSPMLNSINESNDCNMMKRTDLRMNINENLRISSCKMVKTQYSSSNTIDPVKSSYSIQDLESNSGLCLASLPRLDNDIELNFPEVNQQFINANKGENTVLTNSIRDLPTLEVLDQSPNQIKDKFNNTHSLTPENDIDRSPYMVDSEKEFCKLSKYRKSRANSFEPKETRMPPNINAFRTDSVIIKNPENIKKHEENVEFSNNLNKVIMDIQQTPINLTSQASLSDNVESQPHHIELQGTVKEKQLPVEIAIDFSLNKTGILNSTEYMDTEIESHINSSMDIEENPLHNLNKDDSSDSVSLLPVYTAENENFNKVDNIDGNCSLDRDTECVDETESITKKNKKYDVGDFKDTQRINESYLKIENEISKCSPNSSEEMIIDATTALSSSKTVISENNLVSDYNSENCEKIIYNRDVTADELTENVTGTLTEADSEFSQTTIESFDAECELDTTENTPNVILDENFGDNQTSANNLNSPTQTGTEVENVTSEVNNPRELSNSEGAEKTESYNINDTKLLITSDETRHDERENPDLCQARNTNSELHADSIDMVDHIKDNIDDNTTQTLEELSDHEKELNNFDEDTHSDPENSSLCDIDQPDDEDFDQLFEEPIRRNLWYGSKELHSPWIQKLLIFSEGSCNSTLEKNDMNSNTAVLVDSGETVNTTTEMSDDLEYSNCDFKIKTLEMAIEEVSHENVTEEKTLKVSVEKVSLENVTEEKTLNTSVEKVSHENVTEEKIVEMTVEKVSHQNVIKEKTLVMSVEKISHENATEKEILEMTVEKVSHQNLAEEKTLGMSVEEVSHENVTEEKTLQMSVKEVSHENVTEEKTLEMSVEEVSHENVTEEKTLQMSIEEVSHENKTEEKTLEMSVEEVSHENVTEEKTLQMSVKEVSHENVTEEKTLEMSVEEVSNEHETEEKTLQMSVKEVSHENVTEDMILEQDNFNDTSKNTIVTSVLDLPITDNNIDETINPEDDFECENGDIKEANDNKVNEVAVDKGDNVLVSIPLTTREVNETNIIDSCLECEPDSNENTQMNSETEVNSAIETQCELPDTSSNIVEDLCDSVQEETEHCEEQPEAQHAEEESSADFQHVRFSYKELHEDNVSYRKCPRLKRSLSDSAINMYNNDERQKQNNDENVQFIWPYKRRKVNNVNVDNDLLAQNLCNIIHNNRRNSVSSFYNEDVSFCILIDDSCIITEEENEEPEKVCYTELSEECLAEIQSNCTNLEEVTQDVSSPQQENACDYSDSVVLDCEEDKTLEESWDEDVECVETVISDDIAEDIEICEISSPKDDALSDNDESGVFSSSEHTDKVKFIYGDKMCNDDALFVETLYKTPQMDVNKTLYNRETRVSEECDRYYDNDSLEKMLSESNQQPLSPYVPQYMDTLYPSGKVNFKETLEKNNGMDTEPFHTFQGKGNALDIVVDINAGKVNSKETPENKENMELETLHPFQNKGNALDIVVDINVDKDERENMHSIEIFAKTRDDLVRSYESSVDNVFTYNQKDEDPIYTSSSPEVSSTTSEEKGSGILLKITNYKGSRISQVNDISRGDKRSSCKFTEEKDYLHSSNRPLMTKAAQKYIPPLKESIRDLKVKLSLPQHSLMKLKQLKISKDEPKVNKHNDTISRIPKKPKPKFEDVLKSIDEIQFKKHKEKSKKTKKSIPKVVIKKTQNGSHYASTSNKNDFNPDLTGRKWQPWVFIEKNHFIDKMATRNKTKAIYSHRKRTYVLAERFQKYKSASSTKFVISPPVSDNTSSGLKYTIRLKHNY